MKYLVWIALAVAVGVALIIFLVKLYEDRKKNPNLLPVVVPSTANLLPVKVPSTAPLIPLLPKPQNDIQVNKFVSNLTSTLSLNMKIMDLYKTFLEATFRNNSIQILPKSISDAFASYDNSKKKMQPLNSNGSNVNEQIRNYLSAQQTLLSTIYQSSAFQGIFNNPEFIPSNNLQSDIFQSFTLLLQMQLSNFNAYFNGAINPTNSFLDAFNQSMQNTLFRTDILQTVYTFLSYVVNMNNSVLSKELNDSFDTWDKNFPPKSAQEVFTTKDILQFSPIFINYVARFTQAVQNDPKLAQLASSNYKKKNGLDFLTPVLSSFLAAYQSQFANYSAIPK